jgi:hypothetical protein
VSAGKESRTNPWDAQKLDVTGSWSASKSSTPRKRTAEIPETLVAPDIDPLPATPHSGDLLAGRFESSDERSPSFDWDPDGDTDSVPPVEDRDTAEARAEADARADALEVELLSAADPSTDAPTGEMTIPSFGPEVTLESQAPPRVVQGRVANGFVTEGTPSSVWANTPIRAKALGDAPRIELRRRSRRPLVKIDDASAGETTEWMAQGIAHTNTDAEGVPFGPRVVDQTDGGIEVEALSDDAISEIDPAPVKPFPTKASDVIYVRRAAAPSAEADPFRAFVLNRRGPEEETAPPPPWAGMIRQTATWILVVAGGIGLAALCVMALTGRLPF